MRRSDGWGPRGRPGRHIGARIFGFLFFLLFVSAIIGGLVAWAVSPGRGWYLLIGLGVVFVFGFIMSRAFRRSWAPVSDLIDATTELGEGDSSVRMRDRGRGPWSQVTKSFNNMAERLEDEEVRRRRLLADLGHELRTPLTVVRGEIEAVLDGVHQPEALENVVDEVDLMERLLEDLRTLALAEAGTLQLVVERTSLGDLARDVVASFSSVTRAQAVTVDLVVGSDEEVEVDPHRIHQVLSNLVSNALRMMPAGGLLTVSVDGGTIVVSDTGPGVPEDQLDGIFDRFVKAADSSGSGLGLSIARDLVEAHGGSISAGNQPVGGARFTVTLVADSR